MKITSLVLLLLLQFPAPSAHAAFYQWSDAQGVIHFTDDPDKIPSKYLKRARRLKLSGQPAPPQVQAPSQVAKPQAPGPGGQTEQWWRERFSALRDELKTLQDGLPAKRASLVALRRRRAVYMRAQDRVAVNNMQAEVSADEARLSDLQNQIDALEQDAAKALVPAEWRQ
jgi:hypothetical protein